MTLTGGPATLDAGLDEAAFERLITPLLGPAFQVAYQVLGDREAARDAVQEAAITAWQRLDQLRGASPNGWFLKIALNKARALRRRRWFGVVRSSDVAERERGRAASAADIVADRLDLVAVLRRLPAADRITLLLIHAMDLPYAEAAHVLGLSERGVRSRERRALQRIRPYLEDPGGG